MVFYYESAGAPPVGLVVTTFQAAGTLLIALLLRLLTRVIPGQFLHYWSLGWVCLAAALVGLNFSSVITPMLSGRGASWVEWPSLSAFAVFEYAFGFYIWAGCRAYARGTLLAPADWWLLAGPVAFGVASPYFFRDANVLFPFHAALFAGFCLLALLTTLPCRPDNRQTAIGLRFTQAALAGITLLFWHYTVVMGWVLRLEPYPVPFYLQFSALYDGLVELLLAFGMIVLGTDSVRRELALRNLELAQANERLAEASEQLAVAARTDPLTGLLNRRALDAMLAERASGPFAGSVAVVDMNGLKDLNDLSGHAAGDAAIQLVARALRAQFRITDPVFRVGGDEFLVILEGGRTADLMGRLEALDSALKGQRLPGMPTPIDLVVAWGMADYETHAEFQEALARADIAMYACKARRKATTAGRG